MKRRHEEICRAEFDKLAKSIFPDILLEWEEVPQHLEPPDWYLTVGQTRYAVEATSITEYVKTPEAELSSASISASLSAFVNEVEESARQQGILSGAYIVSLCPIPDFPRNRAKFRNDLLDYIRQTQSLSSAPEHVLGYVEHQRVSITKAHAGDDYVAEMISFGAKWGGEAQQELTRLISDTLTTKARKLCDLSVPIVLLLLDAYNYSHLADWIPAVSMCTIKAHFSCICRIAPSDRSTILWANSPEWPALSSG